MRTLAIAGTFIRDKITPLDKKEKQSVGGLYHGLAYAAFLAPLDIQLHPIANIGADFEPELMQQLNNLPNVNLAGLHMCEQNNTTVELIYTSKTEREEISSALMPTLQFAQLQPYLDAEALIVNMITGADIDLNALKQFREISKTLIYLDFHTLALARNSQGKRVPKRPENWTDWLKTVDIVQMNEREADILAGASISTNFEKLASFAGKLFDYGVKGVIITLGERGVLLSEKYKNHSLNQTFLQNNWRQPIVDIIGCGDVFGATFVLEFLKHHDFQKSAKFAMKIASLNTSFLGSITKKTFEEIIKPYATRES